MLAVIMKITTNTTITLESDIVGILLDRPQYDRSGRSGRNGQIPQWERLTRNYLKGSHNAF
jgi:hypothetical protein